MSQNDEPARQGRLKSLAHSAVTILALLVLALALFAGDVLGGSRIAMSVSEYAGRTMPTVLPAYAPSMPSFFLNRTVFTDYGTHGMESPNHAGPRTDDTLEILWSSFERATQRNDPFLQHGVPIGMLDWEFHRWYLLALTAAAALSSLTSAPGDVRSKHWLLHNTSSFVGRLTLILLIISPVFFVLLAIMRPWAWMWGRAVFESNFTAPINYAHPLLQTVIASIATLAAMTVVSTKRAIARGVLAPARAPRRYSRCFDCGFKLDQQPRCPECGRTDPGMESPTILTNAGSWLRQRLTHRQIVLLTLGVLVGLWLMPLLLGLAGIR